MERLGRRDILVLFAVAAAVYLNALTGPFLYDDVDEIQFNPRVHTLRAIPSLLTTDFWYGERGRGILYRPVLAATIPPLFLAGDGSPWPFHAVNILLHALISALIGSIAARLTGSREAGFLTGALFALHPVHAEAVAWISGRSELLFVFFGAAAWRCHLRAREGGGFPWLLLSALGLALSLGSKENAVCWPLIFMAGDWLGASPSRARESATGRPPDPRLEGSPVLLLAPYAAYLAVGVTWAACRYLVLGRIGRLGEAGASLLNPLVGQAWWPTRLLTGLRVLGLAVGVTTAPARPCFDYGFDQVPIAINPAHLDIIATALGLAAVIAALALWGRRARSSGSTLRGIFLGALIFLLAWLPVSNLIVPSVAIFAERNMYLPSLGWCLAAASILAAGRARLPRRRVVVAAVAAASTAAVAGISLLTLARNRDFDGHLSLISTAAENCPRSARAHFLHAAELVNAGRPEESLAAYRRALEIAPGFAEARAELARTLAALGRTREAEVEARAAAASPPPEAAKRLAVASALAVAGLRAEGDALFEETRRIAPDDAGVLYVLGERLKREGDLDGALGAFERLKERYPWNPVGDVGIASIHAKRGEIDAVRRALREALRLDPYDARALYDLGLLALREGSDAGGSREAVEMLGRYVRIQPKDALGWVRLGQAQESIREIAEAERSYRRGLAAAPGHPLPRRALHGFLIRQGRRAEADLLSISPDPESD